MRFVASREYSNSPNPNTMIQSNRLTLLAAISILLACGGSGDQKDGGASLESVVWQDSVRLVETDSEFIAGAGGLSRSTDGVFAVSDVSSGRILLYANDGSFLSSVGRRGRGPGEFLAPSVVEFQGNEILVLDNPTRRVSRFELGNSTPLSALRVPGSAMDMQVVGAGLVVASADVQTETSLAHNVDGADSLVAAGRLPSSYSRFPRLKRNLALGVLAGSERGVWLGMQGSNSIEFYELPRLGRPTYSVEIPRVRRRGVPLERPEVFDAEVSYEDEVGSLSMLWALGQLSDRRLATVHVDATMTDAGLNAVAFLSVVDTASGLGCLDLAIPTESSAVPILRFERDTLFEVTQRESAGGKPETLVRWLDVRAIRCGSSDAT